MKYIKPDLQKDNEIIPIKALLEVLAHNYGVSYQIKCRPDKENSNLTNKPKDIDAIAQLGSCKLAIEHTSIQSLPNQRDDESLIRNLIKPIEPEIEGRLPKPGFFSLLIGYNEIPRDNWNIKRKTKLKEAIIDWLLKSAEILMWSPKYFIEDHLDFNELTIKVTLIRQKLSKDGFQIGRIAPPNLEDKRVDVIYQCLDKRGRKVAGYRIDDYKTVLLLESGIYDISMSNDYLIGDAFVKSASKFNINQLPDEVYLLQSVSNEYWFRSLDFKDSMENEIIGIWDILNWSLVPWT